MGGSISRRVTMSQIAEAAGVSVPTVSKVINQRSDVAPATRERVERLLLEHGYQLEKLGRAAKRGKHGLISLFVHRLDNAYELEIIRGVQQTLAQAGQRLILTTYQSSSEQSGLASLTDGVTDGVILLLADENTTYVRELQQENIPFVVIDRLGELGPDTPSVGATNWAGGRSATQYLISLGHRRIGAILGPMNITCTHGRFAGYRSALDEGDLPFDPELVRSGKFIPETGYEQTKAFLTLPDPPTAIFAGNDEQATGVYRALHERGIAIPEHMSVVGFDDTLIASRLTPPLTTVRQPLFEMGRVATNMLLRLIRDELLDSTRVELPTSLVTRNSCAPPKESS
jgi:LacI family transcriptional regulator